MIAAALCGSIVALLFGLHIVNSTTKWSLFSSQIAWKNESKGAVKRELNGNRKAYAKGNVRGRQALSSPVCRVVHCIVARSRDDWRHFHFRGFILINSLQVKLLAVNKMLSGFNNNKFFLLFFSFISGKLRFTIVVCSTDPVHCHSLHKHYMCACVMFRDFSTLSFCHKSCGVSISVIISFF